MLQLLIPSNLKLMVNWLILKLKLIVLSIDNVAAILRQDNDIIVIIVSMMAISMLLATSYMDFQKITNQSSEYGDHTRADASLRR